MLEIRRKKGYHSFQTVVDNAGANWGLIIASTGFQSGAYEAAEHSNIRLLDWQEFVCEAFTDSSC